VSDTRDPALIGAISEALKGLGLEITGSDREITISNPSLPEKGCFIFDYLGRYVAWERQQYDYRESGHLTDDQAAAFITGKIRETLVEDARLADEFNALVEQARRDNLAARVMSGELDDVNLPRGAWQMEAAGRRYGFGVSVFDLWLPRSAGAQCPYARVVVVCGVCAGSG
jgi:hypothetical protein